jgi:hypothetical protein
VRPRVSAQEDNMNDDNYSTLVTDLRILENQGMYTDQPRLYGVLDGLRNETITIDEASFNPRFQHQLEHLASYALKGKVDIIEEH